MKTFILSFVLLSCAPVFASHHFQCYQVMGSRLADKIFFLIPHLADLSSGASFSNASDNGDEIEYFSFIGKSGGKLKKSSLKLLGSNGSLLKIDGTGNVRNMEIKGNDKVVAEFQCFIESSI